MTPLWQEEAVGVTWAAFMAAAFTAAGHPFHLAVFGTVAVYALSRGGAAALRGAASFVRCYRRTPNGGGGR